MTAMKSFVMEQILLVTNSVNDKFGNNIQLQEKPNEKISNRGNSSSNRGEQNKIIYWRKPLRYVFYAACTKRQF